jgi:hypothetical protein
VKHLTAFLDFLDNRSVFRRVAFIVVLYGTLAVTDWAMQFARDWLASGKSGVEAGAVIVAVTGPFAALQGWVFKLYSETRQGG